MQTLALSTNYYRTGSAVTAGTANATGVITFTYNWGRIPSPNDAGEGRRRLMRLAAFDTDPGL